MPERSVNGLHCVSGAPRLQRHTRSLRLVLAITTLFMLAEFAGGWLANSLALMADAGHMLSDAAAILLSLFVAWMAGRPATPEKTYGYLRAEILAALVNGSALFAIAFFIVWEAARRLQDPPQVEPRILFGVALAGLAANVVSARILHAGHRHSLNVRGAYLHVLGDLLGSIGALAAGVIILLTGWTLADPLISLLVALLVLIGGWRLVKESVNVLLEGTPGHIRLSDVEAAMSDIPGVSDVHDLHVWTLTSGIVAMTGHAVVEDAARQQQVLEIIRERMERRGIDHVTVQLETAPLCAENRGV